MGLCQSDELKSANKLLEKQLDYLARKREDKMLLLGTAGGGKSTLLKQMRLLHANGFKTDEERLGHKGNVYSNIISGVVALLEVFEEKEFHFSLPGTTRTVYKLRGFLVKQVEPRQKQDGDIDMDDSIFRLRTYLIDCIDPYSLLKEPAFVEAAKEFWRDSVVSGELFRLAKASNRVEESLEYYMNDLDRIAGPEYVPTVQDILFMRVPTVGIVEVCFNVGKGKFRVIDVGGQRSERRKWIHCFDNVNSIIFIAAISEYDQVLVEDQKTNRMIEAMQLFGSVCNSKFFQRAAVILFLNKKDLFELKCRAKNIRCLFKNYKGGDSYADQVAYVRRKFEVCLNDDKKQIYTHETCATDTNQIEMILKSILNINMVKMGIR